MFLALLQSMRPKQWIKNGIVFAALIFDVQLFMVEPFLRTLAGFVVLCLLSSAVYLFNDLADIEKDRLHPKKRFRPLAAGRLNKNLALAVAVLLPLVAVPISFLLQWRFGVVACVYLITNVLYSFWLKNVVIVDVLLLAAGYVLRVAAGVALITVERFSPGCISASHCWLCLWASASAAASWCCWATRRQAARARCCRTIRWPTWMS